MWNRISELWCKSMHSKAMWPIHGKYICPNCLREYPVIWEDLPARRESAAQSKPSLNWAAKLKRLGTM
jgi:hypothetical protein